MSRRDSRTAAAMVRSIGLRRPGLVGVLVEGVELDEEGDAVTGLEVLRLLLLLSFFGVVTVVVAPV